MIWGHGEESSVRALPRASTWGRLTLAAAVILALMTAAPIGPRTNAAAADLNLKTEEYPPANFTGPDGEITGITVAIVRRIAEAADVAIDIELGAFNRGLNAAQATPGTCFFGLWRTNQRADEFAWVGPLVQDGYALYARAGSDIALDTLKDSFAYRTGAVSNWGSTKDVKEAGHPNLEIVYDDRMNLRKLRLDRIDLWLSGLLTAPHLAKSEDVPVRQVLVVDTVPLSLGCHPDTDPAILSRLQAALDDLKAEGTVAKLKADFL